jgi:hypothetical protein
VDLGGCLNCKSSLKTQYFVISLQQKIKIIKHDFVKFMGLFFKVVLFMWDKNNELLKKRVHKQRESIKLCIPLLAIT